MTTNRSSKKQQELLAFIDTFIKGNGYGPSYREIMRGLGYKSVSTVAVHVDGLLTKGYIRKKDNSARSIEVITTQPPSQQPVEGVHWLEREIEQRISQPTVSDGDIEALLLAAGVLDSKRVDELRLALAVRKK